VWQVARFAMPARATARFTARWSTDVVLVQRAGVANNIKAPGPYAGSPLMPLKEYMKAQAGIRRLAAMRDTIKRLEKRIAALEP